MPSQEYVLTMARYNMWQNENLITAADSIGEEARQTDRGAFFSSIQKTFSHILWGDKIWMNRFADTPAPDAGIPQSLSLADDWEAFCEERAEFDRTILEWAKNVSSDWFDGDLTWHSGAVSREVTKPKKILIVQLFNHQTHHRGQIHAMLTAAGAKPEDTDVPFMPEKYELI